MAVLTGIELCAGVGMLGEGVRAAFGFLGHDYRTVCYVEREAAAAGQLVTLMEAGIIDPAPVWSDMLTFDGTAWRGKVDCIIAGFPCQDLSIAGRRAGLDGERSGLFFRVCDIADDCGAQFLILENVSAIASATASVVDEAEGELEERAAARVMGELADRGWDAEWITISASDVGASHRRARWFCFAWRVADAERAERGPQRVAGSRGGQGHDGHRQENSRTRVAIQTLADAGCGTTRRQQHQPRTSGEPSEYQFGGEAVADPARHGGNGLDRETWRWRGVRKTGSTMDDPASPRRNGTWLRTETNLESRKRLPSAGCADMAEPARNGRNERRPESTREQRRSDASEHGRSVANSSSTGLQGRKQRGTRIDNRGGQEAHGSVSQLCSAFGIFAPGPDSTDWLEILERYPYLAPATEPGLCGVVDGHPLVVDESRSHQLRAIGNGVVPLQAAVSIVTLVRRSGITFD